jgi:hypothetical protein
VEIADVFADVHAAVDLWAGDGATKGERKKGRAG